MNVNFWAFIEKSKEGKQYVNPAKQFDNLESILTSLSDKEVLQLRAIWSLYTRIVEGSGFDSLHKQNGGFVSGGDDAFHMDFAAWFIAQGEGLYNDFLARDRDAVKDYITRNRVSKGDLTYECLLYAFNSTRFFERHDSSNLLREEVTRLKPVIDPFGHKIDMLLDNVKDVEGYRLVKHDGQNTVGYRFVFLTNTNQTVALDVEKESLSQANNRELYRRSSGDLYLYTHPQTGDLLTEQEMAAGVIVDSISHRLDKVGDVYRRFIYLRPVNPKYIR